MGLQVVVVAMGLQFNLLFHVNVSCLEMEY